MYFSGFCLDNESELFNDYLQKGDFIVSGFSYGAIKALEYTLKSNKRIDKLQLFSPAFFNDKDKKYIRLQLMFFKKDPIVYCDNFLKNCGFDDRQKKQYFKMGCFEELQELLEYKWEDDILNQLTKKGIKIEVYLGSKDKIINSQEALEFFKKQCEVYFIKEVGHIL